MRGKHRNLTVERFKFLSNHSTVFSQYNKIVYYSSQVINEYFFIDILTWNYLKCHKPDK